MIPQIDSSVKDLSLGWLELEQVRVDGDTEALSKALNDLFALTKTTLEQPWRTDRRSAVRALLRHGGFKPSGRSKPAQEYLLRYFTEHSDLPRINAAVELLNAVSLRYELPISLLKNHQGNQWHLRYGRAGENYVFNQAGQILELEGLITLCEEEPSGASPKGSPVKDSMAGKIGADDQRLIVCIYAPRSNCPASELESVVSTMATQYQEICGARITAREVVVGT